MTGDDTAYADLGELAFAYDSVFVRVKPFLMDYGTPAQYLAHWVRVTGNGPAVLPDGVLNFDDATSDAFALRLGHARRGVTHLDEAELKRYGGVRDALRQLRTDADPPDIYRPFPTFADADELGAQLYDHRNPGWDSHPDPEALRRVLTDAWHGEYPRCVCVYPDGTLELRPPDYATWQHYRRVAHTPPVPDVVDPIEGQPRTLAWEVDPRHTQPDATDPGGT